MFGAMFRFFRNLFNRTGQRIDRAADAQYTSSSQGIADGFDAAKDQLVISFREMMTAAATIGTARETKNQIIQGLGEKIARKEAALNGALAVIEKNMGPDGDKAKETKARTDAAEFKKAIDAMKAEKAQGEEDIKGIDARAATLHKQLGELKKKIEDLPAEKAAAVGKFVSNKALMDVFNKMGELKTASERTPLDAINAKLKEMDGQVRVSEQLSHAANTDAEAEYTSEGAASDANDDIAKMLAQRAASRAEKTGETTGQPNDREKI